MWILGLRGLRESFSSLQPIGSLQARTKTWTVASDQAGIWVDIQRPKPALGHAASYHHLPFLAPPTIVLLRTPLSTSNIQDATYAISGPNLKDYKQIKNLYYHFVWNKNWTKRSNQALRTPHCYGQFPLSPGKETHYIFSKFNLLNRDTEGGIYPEQTADIWRRYHWFPQKMTSEKRAQKFHTDNASLPKSGQCFWLVVPRGKFDSTKRSTCHRDFCTRFSDVI